MVTSGIACALKMLDICGATGPKNVHQGHDLSTSRPTHPPSRGEKDTCVYYCCYLFLLLNIYMYVYMCISIFIYIYIDINTCMYMYT